MEPQPNTEKILDGLQKPIWEDQPVPTEFDWVETREKYYNFVEAMKLLNGFADTQDILDLVEEICVPITAYRALEKKAEGMEEALESEPGERIELWRNKFHLAHIAIETAIKDNKVLQAKLTAAEEKLAKVDEWVRKANLWGIGMVELNQILYPDK